MVATKKTWWRILPWATVGLLVFFASRLTNLTSLPIFTDEAIYIRWSQIGARDANWRFISLTDGKQPMFTWITMALLRLLPTHDPVFVGRLTSVLAGAASLIGLWLLAWVLFRNRRGAWLAAVLYLTSPFTLMYDRMALYDSLVATFSIWSLLLAVLLVKTLRLDVALLLGMVLGAGMLNKTSGFISLYLLPTTLLLFDLKESGRWARLGKWVGLAIVASGLSQILYSVLRLSPFFHIVTQKDLVFIYSFAEWSTHPFRFLTGNLMGLLDWISRYLTMPVFLISILPLFTLWSKRAEKVLLYLWWVLPLVALALFGKGLYPRFVLFMVMPLLVLAAVTLRAILRRFAHRGLIVAFFVLTFASSLRTGYAILFDVLNVPIPESDRQQYLDDWPAGWGIREVNAYLAERLKTEKVTVYTDGTFGLLPYAIEMYHVDNPNITIRGVWPLPKEPPEDILDRASQETTYLVLNQTQALHGWPLMLVAKYQKGKRTDRALRLYKVHADKPGLRRAL